MKKTKRKIAALAVVVSMLIGMLPVGVMAKDRNRGSWGVYSYGPGAQLKYSSVELYYTTDEKLKFLQSLQEDVIIRMLKLGVRMETYIWMEI